ncbi:MAG: carboxypeptidase-like regulatory domain-containing protein, partial [Tannerella sp.]|nr:carboxypeptidase-like regulatory domain-containing protein [Tannerella sp.]
MRKLNYFYLILFLLFFPNEYLLAQDINISGTVTDNEGLTLPGVSVVVKGTTTGISTDIDGQYSLKASKGSVLTFSYIGYESQDIKINNQTQINVTLQESTLGLDEVVVVAYGTQSRRMLTSAVSKVNTKELENMAVNNVMEALKGKVAGARIYGSSGQPGESPTIIIRGGSSINKSNSPLILVDGFERSYNEINPNDIES